ncbi:MAG: hypothetical protein R3C01_13510 [Planctomycetaceae bacterium]
MKRHVKQPSISRYAFWADAMALTGVNTNRAGAWTGGPKVQAMD